MDDQVLFPEAVTEPFILGEGLVRVSFSNHVEAFLTGLVDRLIAIKSQTQVIRNAIVAVPVDGINSASSSVTTRDVCRAIRNFSGTPIPDITQIWRIPQTGGAKDQQSSGGLSLNIPLTPSGANSIGLIDPMQSDEKVNTGAAGGVGIGALVSKKKNSTVLPPMLPPTQPKKRGRPSNKDRGILPKTKQHRPV